MKPINSFVKKTLLAASVSMAFAATTAQAQSIEQRLERLERMASNPVMLEMTRKINDQEREIQNLQDQLDRINRDLALKPQSPVPEAVSASGDKAQVSELQKTLEALQAELAQVKKSMEVQGARIIVLEDDLQKIKAHKPAAAIETKAPEQAKTPAVSSLEESQTASSEASVLQPIQTRPASNDEKKAYQEAFGLMRSSDYDGSIKAFSNFIKHSKESDLAANAYYWMGEGYFIQGNFEKALESFQSAYQFYPDSAKTSDAMLRSADALEKLERIEEAKKIYQDVERLFPESRAANNAKKRLEKL